MPQILAENEWLIALNKPAGLISHSDGRTEEPSLAAWLIETYPSLKDIGEPWVSPQGESVPIAGLVHRLDRTTSGVMLAAKTPESYEYLKKEFSERKVNKAYRAIVYGKMPDFLGLVSAEIVRVGEVPKRWDAEDRPADHPRTALTAWRVLASFEADGAWYSYLDVQPRTGRTHQIRVHMKHIGHPLVSDHLYSDKPRALGLERPALHAYSLALILPNMKGATYTAPVPADMKQVLGAVPA